MLTDLRYALRQLLAKLEFAEVNAKLQPDTRDMMRDERFALLAAIHSADGKIIASAMTEAQRVAKMWGVKL